MGGLILLVLSFTEPPVKEAKPDWLPTAANGSLALWAGASVVVALFVWISSGWPALAVGAGALIWVGKLWLRASRERAAYYKTTEAISVWIDMVKDSLGGGAGLSQAIEATVGVAPEIVRPQVVQLASAQRTSSQAQALRDFGSALAHPTSDLVVLALVTASEQQARDLPKLLAKTAEQARTRNASVLQIETERTKLYTEARAMVLSIAILGLIISIIARDFLEPYNTAFGQMVLVVIMIMVVGSAAALIEAGRPQKELRLLAMDQEMAR